MRRRTATPYRSGPQGAEDRWRHVAGRSCQASWKDWRHLTPRARTGTLDQDDKIGSLTPGKQADVIIIDPSALNFAPQLEQINQIVFNGQPANVTWVFVAGKPLKQNGQLVGVDVKKVLRDAQTAVEDIAPTIQP